MFMMHYKKMCPEHEDDDALDFVVRTFGKAVKASTLPAICEATRHRCFFRNFGCLCVGTRLYLVSTDAENSLFRFSWRTNSKEGRLYLRPATNAVAAEETNES